MRSFLTTVRRTAGALQRTSAAPLAALTPCAAVAAPAACRRSLSYAAMPRAPADDGSGTDGPPIVPGNWDPHAPYAPKPPQSPTLPFPEPVKFHGVPGQPGFDSEGVWHEAIPQPPSHKSAIAREIYTNWEIRGGGFTKPKHPNAPDAIHGIGVPSLRIIEGHKLRRKIRPKSVQDIPTPMKTRTFGPREMGNKIVRTFIGHVTSDKMMKTIAVEVSQYYRHPKYHKYVKTSKKFLAHDEEEECNIGDVVEIRVCRPMSKRKHFTLHRILKAKRDIDDAARVFLAHLPNNKVRNRADYKNPKELAEEFAREAEQTHLRLAELRAREALEEGFQLSDSEIAILKEAGHTFDEDGNVASLESTGVEQQQAVTALSDAEAPLSEAERLEIEEEKREKRAAKRAAKKAKDTLHTQPTDMLHKTSKSKAVKGASKKK